MTEFSRRDAIAVIGASSALVTVPGIAKTRSTGGVRTDEAQAQKQLERVAEHFLALAPETATSLGVDKGARAGLRSRLGERSQTGQDRLRDMIASDLRTIERLDLSGLSHSTRTSLQVVKSAYRTALKGFALPYGDVAVGGFRNSPYVVSQNTGAYLDTPKFLDTDHVIESAADAEAYLARLDQYPAQLDGELARMKATAAQGVIAPGFVIDKALVALAASAKGAHEGGALVESIERRTKAIPGHWSERARAIASARVAPALERQIAELRSQRVHATDVAGIGARPHGAREGGSIRA